MNDSLVPEWMKKRQAEQELVEAKAEARRAKMLAALALIKAKSPEFCVAVKKNLKIAVDSLPVLKLTGQLTEFGGSLRVSAQCPGIFPNQTYTDIAFTDKGIELRRLNGGFHELEFCVISEAEIAVSWMTDGGNTLNPDEVSEYIMTQIISEIEARKA